MKIILSRNGSKARLKQFVNWRDNELLKNKGHKRVRDKNGNWVKIKKN